MWALWYCTPSSFQHCRNCPCMDKTARLAVCKTFVPTEEGLPWSKCEGNPSPGHIHQAVVAAGCIKILKQPVRVLRSCWSWWQHLPYSQDLCLVSEVCEGDKSSALRLSAPAVNHLNGLDSHSREQRALTLTKMDSTQNVSYWCCPIGYKWYLSLGVWGFFLPP